MRKTYGEQMIAVGWPDRPAMAWANEAVSNAQSITGTLIYRITGLMPFLPRAGDAADR
ncbi:MAG: hypothetical protein HY000_07470 [Planctomycetes bacterium]|nr:hypothetical protein [Planctomycetota bacterium]